MYDSGTYAGIDVATKGVWFSTTGLPEDNFIPKVAAHGCPAGLVAHFLKSLFYFLLLLL